MTALSPGSGQRIIVSRPEQLDRLAPQTLAGASCYVLNSAAAPPTSAEEPVDPAVLGGLHAKVFVAERSGEAHLFIGSANATEAALHGNVEVLVEFVGPADRIGIQAIVESESSLRDLLDEYHPSGMPEDAESGDAWLLEETLREIAQVPLVATVVEYPHGYEMVVGSAETLNLKSDVSPGLAQSGCSG